LAKRTSVGKLGRVVLVKQSAVLLELDLQRTHHRMLVGTVGYLFEFAVVVLDTLDLPIADPLDAGGGRVLVYV
jgi:hypothetical protein